jgi:NADPH-dependent ferric siderophore reductase
MTTAPLPARTMVRHAMERRTLDVVAVRDVTPTMRRITLSGSTLDGFTAPGPDDHIKVFFPDPTTGVLTLPETGPGGVQSIPFGRPDQLGRPDLLAQPGPIVERGQVIARDFTPREVRAAAHGRAAELDIDFVLHGDAAPATAWASSATVGSTLTIGGPRGSKLVPEGLDSALLVADPTSLPSLLRWIERMPDDVDLRAIAVVPDESYRRYVAESPFADTAEWIWIIDPDADARAEALLSVLHMLELPENGFVWAAGEAQSLVPVRRYLRRELGFDRSRVLVDGYWKRGTSNLDHHAPLDETDPD